jgi:hypothetical protein
VHHTARKALDTGPLRRVAMVVVIVSGTHKEEGAGKLTHVFFLTLRRCVADLKGPSRLGRGPGGPPYSVVKPDLLVNTVDRRGPLDVLQNRGPVGDGFGIGPGPKGVPKCEHVGIRAYAGVPEQIPGAAYRAPTFKNRITLGGTARL